MPCIPLAGHSYRQAQLCAHRLGTQRLRYTLDDYYEFAYNSLDDTGASTPGRNVSGNNRIGLRGTPGTYLIAEPFERRTRLAISDHRARRAPVRVVSE